MGNNPNQQLSKGAQYIFVGIAIALSLLVVAVTILVFVTSV
jgi:hypothetical protein